jgi:hypothetical protein
MDIKAKIKGVDEWSRVIIETERGTKLCDINCHAREVLENRPSLADWHTMTPDYGEPDARLSSGVKIIIVSNFDENP